MSLKIFQLNFCTLEKYWFPNFHKDYCSCKKNPPYSNFDKVVMDCNGSQMSELLFPSQCFCICPMSFFLFDKEHQDSIYIRLLLPMSETLNLDIELSKFGWLSRMRQHAGNFLNDSSDNVRSFWQMSNVFT